MLGADAPGFTATTDELDAAFVRVGFEIEDIVVYPTTSGPLVLGRVESIEELEGFKKPIRFCQVEVGESHPRGIVCGARNFVEGDLIVAALPGAVLPGDFTIAARETYGRVSDGMICSVSELGIGSDHDGILVVPADTGSPGADARTVLGLNDAVIDVNVTPDRGYAFSARGLARELASSFEQTFTDPAAAYYGVIDDAQSTPWPVSIDDASKATRYCASVIRGVDAHAASPWWMRKRLLAAGVRPISAIVDVTNYVMMELGQPLHAFDASMVRGAIVVRPARAGETLKTLDGVVRTLDVGDVVIADDSGPIAMAGVMGGESTEVGDSTTDVLLESATFDPVSVFRTGRRHKLTSEASKRFERTVDPALAPVALQRAAALIAGIAGGTIEPGHTDVGQLPQQYSIDIATDLPDRTAGLDYPAGTTVERLREIGCTVDESGTPLLRVTPPTWRPDLRQRADLVEEVLRLEGLENIPAVVPSAPAGRGLDPSQRRKRSVGRALAAAGYVEVLPFPFLPQDVFDLWRLPADDPWRSTMRVLNPLESARPELHSTLLPGLVEMAVRNVTRGQRDVSVYCIGQVVLPHADVAPVAAIDVTRRPEDAQIAELIGSLPHQPVHVAIVAAGAFELSGPWGSGRSVQASDAFEAARIIATAAGVAVRFVADDRMPWHPGRCARVVTDGSDGSFIDLGWAGELHPAVVEAAGLPARSCAVELDIDAMPLPTNLPSPSLSLYPAVLQDLSVVVDANITADRVSAALADGAGELLEDIRLYDVFVGDQAGEGKKSLTFALRFRAADRTLTEDDASAARDAAVAHADALFGASYR